MNQHSNNLLQEIAERSKFLSQVASELKSELIGIDPVIDRVMDSIRAWYVLPSMICRPVIVCLWGLTGTGKTQLTRLLAQKLGFYDRFVEVQMDGFSNGFSSSSSISGMLSESCILEGEPGILVLDEFQRFRTIDSHGEDQKVERYMDLWALLSDGRLSPSVTAIGELEQSIANTLFGEERKQGNLFFDEMDLTVKSSNPTERKYQISPYKANEIRQILKLKEPILEIMTWSPQNIHERMQVFRQQHANWETDYSKLLILVCGNLDEMYEETARRVTDCDTDADIFHEQTKSLSVIDVKRALEKRFKPEQIARLGNNHVVYPSFNRATFGQLIEQACKRYTDEMKAKSGLEFVLADDLLQQIYRNAVFPAQGTRPVFSTVHSVVSSALLHFTLWALELGARSGDKILITVHEDKKHLKAHWRTSSLLCPVTFDLNGLKQRTDDNFKALLAVHEAGHALVYTLLFRKLPQEIKINAASFTGGYNSFKRLSAMSGRNILDQICVALSGRVAEAMVFGNQCVTTGSDNDIQKATALAAQYVRHWGFGKQLSRTDVTDTSEENINTDIDPTNAEIESLLQLQHERAQTLLKDNHDVFVHIIGALEADGMVQPFQLAKWLHMSVEEGGEVLEPYAQKLHDFVQRKASVWQELPLKAA
jgi:cell division protease FtsH